MFLRPKCTFGTIEAKKANTWTLLKMVLLRKTWGKRVKEYPFNINWPYSTILASFAIFFPEPTLLSQNYWAYIWLQFIKWKAKALTHVAGDVGVGGQDQLSMVQFYTILLCWFLARVLLRYFDKISWGIHLPMKLRAKVRSKILWDTSWRRSADQRRADLVI